MCHNYNGSGHIALVCKKSGVNSMCIEEEVSRRTGPVHEQEELYVVYDVYAMSRSVPLKIENNDCFMQLDTGSALSLAPLCLINEVCPDVTSRPTNVMLKTYTRETVHPSGKHL